MDREFHDFMKRVDNLLTRRIGLGHMDLPDAPWYDYYADGLSPRQAIEASHDWTDLPYWEV